MFCPVCRDEFRAGFTRCANCDVDLVEDLSRAAAAAPAKRRSEPAAQPDPVVSTVNYCGFLDLDTARGARAKLREHGIRSVILIVDDAETGEEEFWLRVESRRFAQAAAVLGFDEASHEAVDEGGFRCGNCGGDVAEHEQFCSGCGARFDED